MPADLPTDTERTHDGTELCASAPLPPAQASHLTRDLESLLPHFIRAEANLLRLPLFALHTKGLKTLDGIECRGRSSRDGQTHEFTFRATRNTDTLYPGPLARAAHGAFLDLMTERGLPLENPIIWSWRDLCRRMNIEYGGWVVLRLKEAIKSTVGLMIHSEYALYSKPDGALLHTHQDCLHLYERVQFSGTPLPDGSTVEINSLWLSHWYLANLNALHTAPLDYQLWCMFDERSPIASRLYEFLLINFYSGTPVLRINYETLAQFLPIRPERYRSSAQRQLEPALKLLSDAGILEHVTWGDAKNGIAQLQLFRGQRLLSPTGREPLLPFLDVSEDFASAIEVKELRNLKPPEWMIVEEFYRLWAGQKGCRPTPKEIAQANNLIAEHGPAKAKTVVSFAINHLKTKWPDAKTFGAVLKYLPEALADYNCQQRQAERRRKEKLQEKQEAESAARNAQERAALKGIWETLPEAERRSIRTQVLASQPRQLEKHPSILEGFCLRELQRRQESQSTETTLGA